MVAYSVAMLATPPRTRWHDAACSRAEPSPGFLATTQLPYIVSLSSTMPTSFNTSSGSEPLSRLTFSSAITASALPTYAGSLRERANFARRMGLERYEEVSPEGMSSSVVVTGSVSTETAFMRTLFARGICSGQSAMLLPYTSSVSG